VSPVRLICRSLVHHRRIHAAVGLAVVAATAVLTGALVVGDSLRGSLRHLALDRLGRIDRALVADRFFRAALAEELSAQGQFADHFAAAVPAILLEGTVENAKEKLQTGATLLAAGEDIAALGPGGPSRPLGPRETVLNAQLAQALSVSVGDDVVVRIRQASAIPAESALGRKEDEAQSTRLKVVEVLPDRGLASFSLRPNQQLPKNAFVPLATLQRVLGQPDRVNALFATVASPVGEPSLAPVDALDRNLRPRLEDYGLDLAEVQVPGGGRYVQLTSDRMLLPAAAEEAALAAWADEGARPVLTYLANTLAPVREPQPDAPPLETPYSTIAALDLASAPPLGPFRDAEGEPIGPLGDDQIVLNRWAADDLAAAPGDTIAVTFFEPESSHGEAVERTTPFRLAAVVEFTDADGEPAGPAGDRRLTPELEGVTDEASMANWDAPFPYDSRRVRDKDEDYWDRYRATPKAFVSLAAGRKLWSSRFGRTTAVQVPLDGDTTPAALAAQLKLEPARLGLRFQPTRLQALQAAQGTTPFNFLFLGFSFFIIAAALMLVGLLFKLNIEQRAAELGTLAALGIPGRSARRWLAVEGLAIAALGGLVGVPAGVAYAALMIHGLRTWWLAAVSTPFLSLHWTWPSLAVGCASGVFVSFAVMAWSLHQMRRVPVRRLLANQASDLPKAAARRRPASALVAVASMLLAVAVGLFALRLEGEAQAGAFFGSGALILAASLAWLWRRMKSETGAAAVTAGAAPLARLAARNGSRNPGRSALTMGLVAAATFLIVAISAFRLAPPDEAHRLEGGTGGFSLLAESDPLRHDLDTQAGRRALGFPSQDQTVFQDTRIYSLRVRAGDDASCLNLYQVGRPRLLGVPADLIDRGGFAWAATLAATEEEQSNPWLLLRAPAQASTQAAIPAVLDFNTATYSLHKKLGDTIDLEGDGGETVRLTIVGLLKNSIFQGDVIVDEQALLARFPTTDGFRMFLVATPPGDAVETVRRTLARRLGRQGMAVERTDERLAGFLAVQNTYLSTFQSLGGLGLLLGTFGLATVQLRNVLERRAELALLRAAGFRRGRLARLVVLENLALLVGGLGLGVTAALVTVLPHLASGGASIPWASLAGTLGLVLLVGFLAGLAAVRATLRAPLLPALRGE
jgi:ABC-type antimicrobial peptide transport system permease subunit